MWTRCRSTTQGAPEIKGFDVANGNEWNVVCIDRHSGSANCIFADFSTVRPVGLKELWPLKRHRGFTARPVADTE
jgi:prepilin-type processing-associated H-X9-DG protein